MMNLLKKKFILLVVSLLLASLSIDADTTATQQYLPPASPDSMKIVSIEFRGNRVTNPRILRIYLGLDTGMVFDSALAADGKRRILNTGLFSKLNIVTLRQNDGVHVYVIMTELFYIYPDGGGEYVETKYGIRQIWYRLSLGLSIQNFRGLFETFSIHGAVWEDRSLAVSWSKPLIPTPYFIRLGAGVRDYPDLNFPRRCLAINGRVVAGRRLFSNSRVSLSLIPTYSRIDSLYDKSNIKIFKELYSAVGWSTDRRDRSYDASRGWSISADAFTNVLYAGNYNKYLQLNTDMRLYHRGLFRNDRFAYRAQLITRTNDAGGYKRIYIGGEGSVRGFARDQFGLSGVMNDYAVLSAEYRFPLWTTPSFDIWLLSDYSDMLKSFFLRLDGALIFDAGHIWYDLAHPFTQRENGAGVGAGIRIMAPTLLRSLCFDVVWGIPGTSNPLGFKLSAVPGAYLYLDSYF